MRTFLSQIDFEIGEGQLSRAESSNPPTQANPASATAGRPACTCSWKRTASVVRCSAVYHEATCRPR